MLHIGSLLPQLAEQFGHRDQVCGTEAEAALGCDSESVREPQVGPCLRKASLSPVRAHPDDHRLGSLHADPLLQLESLPSQGMERMRQREALR